MCEWTVFVIKTNGPFATRRTKRLSEVRSDCLYPPYSPRGFPFCLRLSFSHSRRHSRQGFLPFCFPLRRPSRRGSTAECTLRNPQRQGPDGVGGSDFSHSDFHLDSHFSRASDSLISVTVVSPPDFIPSAPLPRKKIVRTRIAFATRERRRTHDDFCMGGRPTDEFSLPTVFLVADTGERRCNPASSNAYCVPVPLRGL